MKSRSKAKTTTKMDSKTKTQIKMLNHPETIIKAFQFSQATHKLRDAMDLPIPAFLMTVAVQAEAAKTAWPEAYAAAVKVIEQRDQTAN